MKTLRAVCVTVIAILFLSLLTGGQVQAQDYCEPPTEDGLSICVRKGVACIRDGDLKLCAWSAPKNHVKVCVGDTLEVSNFYHLEHRTKEIKRGTTYLPSGLELPEYAMLDTGGGLFQPNPPGTVDQIEYRGFVPAQIVDLDYTILLQPNGPSRDTLGRWITFTGSKAVRGWYEDNTYYGISFPSTYPPFPWTQTVKFGECVFFPLMLRE